MILRLFETHIRVANLERSRYFYEELLELEAGWVDEQRRRVLYWVGGPGRSMLGMREVPPELIARQHFSFEVTVEDMHRAAAFLTERGIHCHNFIDNGPSPQVFGWMPAVALYFRDPDEHLLEFLAMLPDRPRPEIGLVSWEEWNRLRDSREQ